MIARVVAVERLDLDHLAPWSASSMVQIRTGQHLREVDHLQAGQGAGDVGHSKRLFEFRHERKEVPTKT